MVLSAAVCSIHALIFPVLGLCFCRWLVLAITMMRFYVQKGTHKGLYRSIARTLKFFQTFALVEVKPISQKSIFNSGKTQLTISAPCCVFVLQVGHCAVGMWCFQLFFALSTFLYFNPLVQTLLLFFFWLCCRNREDFCDCNRGSSVLTDFHGLVRHQQHQTGERDASSATNYIHLYLYYSTHGKRSSQEFFLYFLSTTECIIIKFIQIVFILVRINSHKTSAVK